MLIDRYLPSFDETYIYEASGVVRRIKTVAEQKEREAVAVI